jgi:hypothetical protein
MKLPNAARAVVDIGKLRDYSLNPTHDVGKHKARVFQSALGLTISDADWLREQLLGLAQTGEAVPGVPSPFGETYVIDAEISHGGQAAIVRTSWIVEYGTDFPRLTTCYVKGK